MTISVDFSIPSVHESFIPQLNFPPIKTESLLILSGRRLGRGGHALVKCVPSTQTAWVSFEGREDSRCTKLTK